MKCWIRWHRRRYFHDAISVSARAQSGVTVVRRWKCTVTKQRWWSLFCWRRSSPWTASLPTTTATAMSVMSHTKVCGSHYFNHLIALNNSKTKLDYLLELLLEQNLFSSWPAAASNPQHQSSEMLMVYGVDKVFSLQFDTVQFSCWWIHVY